MNPLDWSLIAGPLPVILLVSALLALAWLAAGRNAPGRGSSRRGARGGSAGGAASVRWLAIWVPLIVVAAGGVTAVLTWLINNVWRPFPDLLPFPLVLWSWVALAGLGLAVARQPVARTWPRRAAAVAAGILVLAAAANQVNVFFQADPSLRVVLAAWLDPKPVFTGIPNVTEVVARRGQALASVWRPPRGMPAAGKVYQVDIPGVVSGFRARPGYLYLPPAYLAAPRAQLPVLVLLAGRADLQVAGDPGRHVDGQVRLHAAQPRVQAQRVAEITAQVIGHHHDRGQAVVGSGETVHHRLDLAGVDPGTRFARLPAQQHQHRKLRPGRG